MAETPPNASPRPAVTPWRRPNLQLSHGGLQQQWPAASTVHGCGSSSGAGSHQQRRVSEVMPRDCLITPAHAARGLGMLAAVARDRGSERGVTARPEAGSRGHAPSATNAEVKFSDVGGHIRGARHGRQQRLVGGPGGDPHLGGYLGRRPEGWQRRRGAQSQPRLCPTPAGRKSGSTLPPFDLRIIRLCISSTAAGRGACTQVALSERFRSTMGNLIANLISLLVIRLAPLGANHPLLQRALAPSRCASVVPAQRRQLRHS